MRSYWVVSPNVRNNESTVSAWRGASVLGRAAFMGYKPGDHPIGDRFVHGIKPGDVILIARRHRFKAEVVGFGVVKGKAKRAIKNVRTPQGFGAARKLSPFIPMSRVPAGIETRDVLKHTSALARLHPGSREAHARVCKWIDRRLLQINTNPSKGLPSKTEGDGKQLEKTQLLDSPKNHQLDYVIRSKKQITKQRKTKPAC